MSVPKVSRLSLLLHSLLGPDLGCSSDWENSAYLVASSARGDGSGWFLVESSETSGHWDLGYRSSFGRSDDWQFEVDNSFSPLELLRWLRSPAGFCVVQRAAGSLERL
jgi:hypothetical protein